MSPEITLKGIIFIWVMFGLTLIVVIYTILQFFYLIYLLHKFSNSTDDAEKEILVLKIAHLLTKK